MRENPDGSKTYTLDDLEKMSDEEIVELSQRRGIVMRGTAVVRRADGTIKYDDPSLKGTYGET